jgi:hypothetical protein
MSLAGVGAIRIVHGFPTMCDVGVRYAHAWIEWRGWCIEPYGNLRQRKREYYSARRIDPEECRRYTLRQAGQKMIETGHYGYWHDDPAWLAHMRSEVVDAWPTLAAASDEDIAKHYDKLRREKQA